MHFKLLRSMNQFSWKSKIVILSDQNFATKIRLSSLPQRPNFSRHEIWTMGTYSAVPCGVLEPEIACSNHMLQKKDNSITRPTSPDMLAKFPDKYVSTYENTCRIPQRYSTWCENIFHPEIYGPKFHVPFPLLWFVPQTTFSGSNASSLVFGILVSFHCEMLEGTSNITVWKNLNSS